MQISPRQLAKRITLLMLAYVLAVTSGSIVYSLTLCMVAQFLMHRADAWGYFFLVVFASFAAGTVFGIPYTVAFTLMVRKCRLYGKIVFIFIGMFGPSTAILLLMQEVSRDTVQMMFLSLPAGIVSAWIYGAIGFGFGFRSWPEPGGRNKRL